MDRKQVAKKILNIAKSLLDIHNYFSLNAIFTGLSAHVINEYIWNTVGKKSSELLDLHKKLSDPTKTYHELRDKLKDPGKNTIPLLTVCLRELRNLEETMSDYTITRDAEGKDVQLINFKKYQLITDIINSIIQYQKTFNIEYERKDPVYSFLVCLPVLSDEDIKSRLHEFAKESTHF